MIYSTRLLSQYVRLHKSDSETPTTAAFTETTKEEEAPSKRLAFLLFQREF